MIKIKGVSTMIEFKKYEEESVVLNPLKNYEKEVHKVEARVDPLTGFISFVRRGRRFWSFMYKTDYQQIERLLFETKDRCVFCPHMVEEKTPVFSEDFIPEKRLRRNEAILIPNLFPHKAHSAIVVLSQKHYLRLDEFSENLLFDALIVSDEFIRRVYEKYRVEYAQIGANYLYPAGSSIVHPHIQVTLSKFPYTLIALYQERARAFFEEKGVNYFEALIEAEKRIDERFISELGAVVFLSPFAPIREDQVDGIVRKKTSFLDFKEEDWKNIATGISLVLKAYAHKGLSAFNFAIYSGPLGAKLPYITCGLKVVSRTSVQLFPVSDTWFANSLLLEGLVVEAPEDVAKFMKQYFRNLSAKWA